MKHSEVVLELLGIKLVSRPHVLELLLPLLQDTLHSHLERMEVFGVVTMNNLQGNVTSSHPTEY
eukprot:767579-Hanusia_phi.AAC.4